MYSTVEELHIALDQSIQYINSNREQGLVPEEKDMLLNAAVREFISTRSNPKTNYRKEGYEETQKRLDDLRGLKRTTPNSLTAYVKDSSTVYSIIPSDYLHHVSSSSEVYHDCKTLVTSSNTANYGYIAIDFPKDSTANTYKYGSLVIKVTYVGTPNVLETIYTLNTALATLSNPDSKFEIINHILEEINTTSTYYKIYWENYDNLYLKNKFIIVGIGARTLVSGYLQYTGYNAIPVVTNVTNVSRTNLTTSAGTSFSPNDIVSSTVNDVMFNNYYYNKNRQNRPISWIEGNRLYVHTNTDFKVLSIDMTYIKKPRLISYKLNQTCELECGEEIISIATRMYKAKINSENQESIINESIKQE